MGFLHKEKNPISNKSNTDSFLLCLPRPIVLVTVRNHDARSRDLNVLTKFIIYILVSATQVKDIKIIMEILW